MTDRRSTNEDTERCHTTQLEIDINSKLADLSTPFNWDLNVTSISGKSEELVLKMQDEYLQMVADRQEYFPEFVLIYHLTQAYDRTVKNDLINAMESLAEAEESLADITQNASSETRATLKHVESVLHHVFTEAKCHVLKKLGRLTEVVELLEGIHDIEDMTETELAMLIGCHCLAISIRGTDPAMGIKYAKLAIKYDPNNGKHHFLLAQHHRDLRRWYYSLSQVPNEEEISALREAYKLFPNVLFGVSLAQLYRESRNCTMANKIYREVHALQPTSYTVQFQLALGFIRTNECVLAKECLDYIAEKMPESIRYTHYMAIYHERCNKDYKTALSYYKRTTEDANFSAEWQYVVCKKTVEPDWDPLPHLLSLLEKYENYVANVVLEINLQIGSYYLFEMQDIISACQYLTKAIEIDPRNKRLRVHALIFCQFKRVNIYHILAKKIEYALETGTAVYDGEKITVLKTTLELCRKNCMDLSSPVFSRTQDSRAMQLPKSHRSYDQGSSSCPETNWRKERSSSPVRAFSRDYPPKKCNDGLNAPQRSSGSSRGREYTSWRSDKPTTQGNRNEHRLSNALDGGKNPASSNHARGGGNGPTASSSSAHNEKEDSKRDASCTLVKNVNDLNL